MRTDKRTTTPGYVNKNGQITIKRTELPGNDHLQWTYVLCCSHCLELYGANGSDIFQRKCPSCQDGAPGLPIK